MSHVCMSYAEREQTRKKCGQSGQGQNGHFHFRIRSFAHYNINIINIYIIVADFDNWKTILTKWPNDQNDRMIIEKTVLKKNWKIFWKLFENRNAGVVPLRQNWDATARMGGGSAKAKRACLYVHLAPQLQCLRKQGAQPEFCRLHEPTHAHSRAMHVQTPESAKRDRKNE